MAVLVLAYRNLGMTFVQRRPGEVEPKYSGKA